MSKSTHTSQDRRKPITITRQLTITSWAHKPNKCKYKYTMLVYNIQHLLVSFKLSALSYSGVLTSNLHFVVDIVSLQLSSLDEPVLLCFSSRFTMLSSLPFCTVSVCLLFVCLLFQSIHFPHLLSGSLCSGPELYIVQITPTSTLCCIQILLTSTHSFQRRGCSSPVVIIRHWFRLSAVCMLHVDLEVQTVP